MAGELFLYAVQNAAGQFFRAKGRDGYGQTWVDGLETAKVYGKIGPARGTVSYFANAFPAYPVPKLVKLVIETVEVVDETARVKKVRAAKKRHQAASELASKKWRLQQAEADLKKAQEALRQAKGGGA